MATEPTPPNKLQGELFPVDVIRTETVLSRNPVHQLSTRGGIDIAITRMDPAGKLLFRWQVSHNSRFGPPGPLAYRVDTLVVNRRLDEAGRPTPEVLRLGSLREICAELDLAGGKSTQDVKRALQQNAFAGITARLDYTSTDGAERTFEFNGTRYAVVFTGEKLPDGRKANAVFLVLHRPYRELLDSAPFRPLDYEYLRSLAPSVQRFYELVSFQVFAAIKHGRPTARYQYGDLCTFAPQARYDEWERVRKQMHKLHKPHLESGYLSGVTWEETTDAQGRPDWVFWYTPGPRAFDEFNAFAARRQGRRRLPEPPPRRTSAPPAAPLPEPPPSAPPEPDAELVALLVAAEMNRADAVRLALAKPEECRRQLGFLPHVQTFTSGKGAYLRSAIEGGYGPPKGYGGRRTVRTVSAGSARTAPEKGTGQPADVSGQRPSGGGDWPAWWESQPEAQRAEWTAAAVAELRQENRVLADLHAKRPNSALVRAALEPLLKRLAGWGRG